MRLCLVLALFLPAVFSGRGGRRVFAAGCVRFQYGPALAQRTRKPVQPNAQDSARPDPGVPREDRIERPGSSGAIAARNARAKVRQNPIVAAQQISWPAD